MATAGKQHRKKSSGTKARKRKTAEQKKKGVLEDAQAARANNPKAFSFQSANKARAQHARSAEREQRRLHGAIRPLHAAES
jgi:ribosome biogenesis protein BMS1